ncbi:hypothetical protein [Marivirga harenae]|uniref:hypothetical protein n=1 Tax=Marivirga harenae TaxID=2010992 RepID=UPI0026E02801|nr:hypothetical protein [Marivirga harenae]WKV11838.1 hypothetical protein Q3Y49_16675 [Marivirga harenae]
MKYLAIIISLAYFQVGWGQSVTELKNINPELGKEYEILNIQTSEDEELLRFVNYDSVSLHKKRLKKLHFFEVQDEIAYLKAALDTIQVTLGVDKILQEMPKEWIDIHRYRNEFFYYSHSNNIYRQRLFENGYIKLQYMDGLYFVKVVDAKKLRNNKIQFETVAYDYNGKFRSGTLEIGEVEENSEVYYWKGNYQREFEEIYLMTPTEVVEDYPILVELYWSTSFHGGPGFKGFSTRKYLQKFREK